MANKIEKQISTLENNLKEILKNHPYMEEELLHTTMADMLDKVPKECEYKVFKNFTYILGRHMGLTDEEITKELLS